MRTGSFLQTSWSGAGIIARAAALAVALVVSGPVYAAGPIVRVIAGEALVNSGNGFRNVPAGSVVEPGNQVLALRRSENLAP